MTQRHVDLLMKAVNLDISDEFLCNRIGYLTGRYLTNIVRVGHYSVNDYEVCVKVISKNIAENFYHNEAIWVEGQYLPTYTETTYFVKGMTRKEWAETILAPLFLDIEED